MKAVRLEWRYRYVIFTGEPESELLFFIWNLKSWKFYDFSFFPTFRNGAAAGQALICYIFKIILCNLWFLSTKNLILMILNSQGSKNQCLIGLDNSLSYVLGCSISPCGSKKCSNFIIFHPFSMKFFSVVGKNICWIRSNRSFWAKLMFSCQYTDFFKKLVFFNVANEF